MKLRSLNEPRVSARIERLLKMTLVSLGAILLLFNTNTAHATKFLIYGDSLSAAYGMDLEQGWVNLLAQKLGNNHAIENASISGETSVGGLARLSNTLSELKPEVLVLELGANDGLRGYPVKKIHSNLIEMIRLAKLQSAQVIVAGISLPASYGPRYIDQFRSIFPSVANQENVLFLDLYIESLVTTPGMIQEDGLHPTSKAQKQIADYVYDFLREEELIN